MGRGGTCSVHSNNEVTEYNFLKEYKKNKVGEIRAQGLNKEVVAENILETLHICLWFTLPSSYHVREHKHVKSDFETKQEILR